MKLLFLSLITACWLFYAPATVSSAFPEARPYMFQPDQVEDLGDNLTLTASGAGADGSSKASGSSYNNVRDGDTTTFWSPASSSGEYVAVKWSGDISSTTIILREPSNSVTDWHLETKEGQILASGSSIGNELLIQYNLISTQKIYLYLNSASSIPQISEFEVYNEDSASTNSHILSTSSSPSTGGIISIDPLGSPYPTGTIVNLTAHADSGFSFSGWSGDVSGTDTVISVTMNSDIQAIAVFSPEGSGGNIDPYSIYGYAMVNGVTTGGFGGNTVLVSNGIDLQDAIKNKGNQPLTIFITGTIDAGNSAGLSKIDIKDVDDLSILGFGNGAEFDGVGIKVTRASNIIIRNLDIHHVLSGDKDAISIEGPADHIWVDHCELHSEYQGVDQDYYDGLFDIKRDVDYVTFSWNYLHDSWKCSLSGSSETDTYDRKVTYHHNFYENINSRAPLFRSGKGHIFNNYYLDIASTAVNTRINACVRIENNYFENTKNPWVSAYSDVLGAAEIIGNELVNSSFDYSRVDVSEPLMCTLPLPYDYSQALDSANAVPAAVMQGAGVGKVFLTNFSTAISEASLSSIASLKVFPNPNDGHFQISLELTKEESLEIDFINLTGQTVRSWTESLYPAGSNSLEVYGEELPRGLYVLRVQGKAGIQTLPVVVQ